MRLVNLLGSGAQADVYEHEGKAVKLFRPGCDKNAVFYEAYANSLVENTGLPVPKVFEISYNNCRWAIIMELIKGSRVNDLIISDSKNSSYYIDQMVNLHVKTQSKEIYGLRSLKRTLKDKILSVDILESDIKDKLILRLNDLPDGRCLCHNDFHSLNIVKDKDSFYIVDWAEAAFGNPEADVCRSYMVYKLYASYMADQYLDLYCKKTNIKKDFVLRWLPIIAAARLTERENHCDETKILLPWINEIINV